MVENTNANISEDSHKIDEDEMRCFVGIMFAVTIFPMSNIKDYGSIKDIGFMVASRFFGKLHMSYKRLAEIRTKRAIAPLQRGWKTLDAIRDI